MNTPYDLLGIGIGPFNLSLAALLSPLQELKTHFFEQKPSFTWHSEIMFADSTMQTTYLKDLVTPVSPTNPHSFLNYLVTHGLFYAHMNTGRGQVSRREFELYCKWVCSNLTSQVTFDSPVSCVEFKDDSFSVAIGSQHFNAKNICVATGSAPWLPEFARPHLSATCFHAKSKELSDVNLTGKRVVIIGGGQTGLEIFRNGFKGKWGQPKKITLVSRRHTLEPLDESPFTNEYFTPDYTEQFYGIDASLKPSIVHHQRFASDGNTPAYLQELYNELYQLKHVYNQGDSVALLPQRRVFNIEQSNGEYQLSIANAFTGNNEHLAADVVILSTGFQNVIPACLNPIKDLIEFDDLGRFKLNEDFSVKWKFEKTHKIFAQNFSRHTHGIAEPQTSLMAWRSGKIINSLTNTLTYPGVAAAPNFTQYKDLSEL
jgi:lysine N6-hydroxylase